MKINTSWKDELLRFAYALLVWGIMAGAVVVMLSSSGCSSSKSLAETKSYQKDGLIGKTNNRYAYYPANYCTDTKIRKKDEKWRPRNWFK